SSCLEGSGARLILTSPEGEEFTYALRFKFDASNNEAEYEALVAGLQIAEKIDSSFQEKSYLTTESSSETICSNTSARNSISVNQAENDEGILLNLDILEERREKAAVREARNKAKMEKYYNAKVRSTSFRLGDFVYRSNEASHAKESRKLGLKWEGPYKVAEALRKGVYKLRNGSGDILPRIWNVQDLKKMLSLISHHVSIPANVKPH
ncbi:reverse transcriptase domain-containing protein, partial [Tanacetum coccineum]